MFEKIVKRRPIKLSGRSTASNDAMKDFMPFPRASMYLLSLSRSSWIMFWVLLRRILKMAFVDQLLIDIKLSKLTHKYVCLPCYHLISSCCGDCHHLNTLVGPRTSWSPSSSCRQVHQVDWNLNAWGSHKYDLAVLPIAIGLKIKFKMIRK